MKKLTIMLPDEFVCCATTAIAVKDDGLYTFTNCFNVESEKETVVVIQNMQDETGYELKRIEPPK